MNFEFKPGSLVTLRDRPWVVLPSDNEEDLLLLKPLGGTDEEITGIYKPLASKSDLPETYNFKKPQKEDLGDFTSAKLLYNASRLSFRSAAGPFRCLGKISFRPRSYQLVPLIMALKQPKTRILISDDVGVGKTIEALLIAKELYERKEISRFAIVCLPHLCDQWQDELKNKFGIEAVIIRSGTANSLERQIRAHENIFRAFPFQIISIDYIKTGNKRQVFIDHCPELIIVDEAHTCAKPEGANNSQQLRYHLLSDLSKKKDQSIVLLTATPHSGKQAEFQSLLGLLKQEFEFVDISNTSDSERKEIAKHFIQRRRVDVLKWLDEETKFPERNSTDIPFEIGSKYAELFNDILSYARDVVAKSSGDGRKQRYNYWDALALLRGVISSPAAGVSMLIKKAQKKQLSDNDDNVSDDISINFDILDNDLSNDDNLPSPILQNISSSIDSESKKLIGFAKRMEDLFGIENDFKAKEALIQAKLLIERGFNPIIFCRYIHTANYLGDIFKENLRGKSFKNIQIEVITSELNDELRKEKIDEMNKSERRLLIATDCLSEGINLQSGFNALIHYDLPFNPNRLEQREGRIDRFGQQSDVVEVALLYGSNNPIDGVVLEVLLRKAREIRKSIGISVPFPENSSTVMEAVTNAILLKPTVSIKQVSQQLSIFEAEEIEQEKNMVAKAFEEAEAREKLSRSRFAQNSIKANELESDLKDIDDAIGNAKAVQDFTIDALRFLGVQIESKKEGFVVFTNNIPEKLRGLLSLKNEISISFKSPTPNGYIYIGRNHPFVEQLSNTIINNSLQNLSNSAARSSVIKTDKVYIKTVIIQLRVRNVILEQPTNKQIVAEEMWLWGYRGSLDAEDFIDKEEALSLLFNITPTSNIDVSESSYWLEDEMKWINEDTIFRKYTDPVALERSNRLVESHSKFRKLVNGNNYKVVEPVLPMDVMGVYILLPELK